VKHAVSTATERVVAPSSNRSIMSLMPRIPGTAPAAEGTGHIFMALTNRFSANVERSIKAREVEEWE
jgi:hypothetical protein